jgi:hypothetical protein
VLPHDAHVTSPRDHRSTGRFRFEGRARRQSCSTLREHPRHQLGPEPERHSSQAVTHPSEADEPRPEPATSKTSTRTGTQRRPPGRRATRPEGPATPPCRSGPTWAPKHPPERGPCCQGTRSIRPSPRRRGVDLDQLPGQSPREHPHRWRTHPTPRTSPQRASPCGPTRPKPRVTRARIPLRATGCPATNHHTVASTTIRHVSATTGCDRRNH